MFHSLYVLHIHSYINGHTDRFRILAFVNSSATNKGTYIFKIVFCFLCKNTQMWSPWIICCCCCSVTNPCPTLCDSMNCSTPGLLACPLLCSWVCSCPLSQWCHPTISSSAALSPLALCVSQHHDLFNELAHHIRWSFSFSISLSNEYKRLIPYGLIGMISLRSKGLSRVLSSTTLWKHQFFSAQPSS